MHKLLADLLVAYLDAVFFDRNSNRQSNSKRTAYEAPHISVYALMQRYAHADIYISKQENKHICSNTSTISKGRKLHKTHKDPFTKS